MKKSSPAGETVGLFLLEAELETPTGAGKCQPAGQKHKENRGGRGASFKKNPMIFPPKERWQTAKSLPPSVKRAARLFFYTPEIFGTYTHAYARTKGEQMAGKKKKPAKQQAKRGPKSRYMAKYGPEMLKYFDKEPFEIKTITQYHQDGTVKSEKEVAWAVSLPTFQGFAAQIGVTDDTLRNWAEKYPEFDGYYRMCKQLQEKILVTNAMMGNYNAQFAQFYAKNCLGYRDKQEMEVTENKLEIVWGDAEKYAH